MLQSRAIKLISDYVLASKLVSGLYLSGSLVKKPEDASGDIHLHLVVEEGKYEAVYQQREKILTAYYSILHLDEEESIQPDLTFALRAGLHHRITSGPSAKLPWPP